MTNDKQQTAVEWYAKQIEILHYDYWAEHISKDEKNQRLKQLKEQAKEMDNEKHEKFNKFLNDEKQLGISDVKTIERIQWYYNTYFNKPTEEMSNE